MNNSLRCSVTTALVPNGPSRLQKPNMIISLIRKIYFEDGFCSSTGIRTLETCRQSFVTTTTELWVSELYLTMPALAQPCCRGVARVPCSRKPRGRCLSTRSFVFFAKTLIPDLPISHHTSVFADVPVESGSRGTHKLSRPGYVREGAAKSLASRFRSSPIKR